MNTLSFINDFFGSDLPQSMYANSYCTPDVDVTQNKDSYTLDMDLPGRSEEDINLELNGRVLTISSKEKTSEKTVSEKGESEDYPVYLLRERRALSFNRRFTLPQDVDGEKIVAGFKNGVLSISIPRKPAAEPRRIEIKRA